MSEKRTEKCDCGQVTHLVTIAGVECYDVDRHGSSAVAAGRCFNCQVPFVSDQPEAVVEGPGIDEPVIKALADMSLKELKVTAAAEQIAITGMRSKADIAAEIESEREARANAEGEVDDPVEDNGIPDDVD